MSTDATPDSAAWREGPATGGGQPAPQHAERARRAWLANKRQELLAPAHALLEMSEMLVEDARELGHEDFLSDLAKICAASRRLLTMIVRDVLDKGPAAAEALARRLRHDLRTPLAEIIGLGEIWLEDAAEQLLEGFIADLEKICDLARRLLGSMDELLKFTLAPAAPEAAAVGMIEDVVVGLPSLEEADGLAAERGALLVVDDNEINRNILVRRLSRQGHSVSVAVDGREALDLVRLQQPDLILLDIIMPRLNGFQVLEALKADERLRHIPVIMISAFNELDSVVRCIEMGAEDYLVKPFNPVLLKARIDACLEKKRLLEQIVKERKRSDELLHVILPREIVKELKGTNTVKPRRFEDVAVMFADIVGFTPFCDRSRPEEVLPHLQKLIETAEEIALGHGVEKIKTIGDAFMAAAGLLQVSANPVMSCLRCGLDLIAASKGLPTGWELRVGIHVGPVVAGVIGHRQYLFDLWGDTVNTAARMESHGVPGSVILTAAAWERVAPFCRGERRGRVLIKGKGELEMIRFAEFLSGHGQPLPEGRKAVE